MAERFYAINCIGGGSDLACAACLPVATAERADSLVSVCSVDGTGEACGWCGREALR